MWGRGEERSERMEAFDEKWRGVQYVTEAFGKIFFKWRDQFKQ